MADEYLIHYGVLGMKWGVKRAARLKTKISNESNPVKKAELSLKLTKQESKNKYIKARALNKSLLQIEKSRQAYNRVKNSFKSENLSKKKMSEVTSFLDTNNQTTAKALIDKAEKRAKTKETVKKTLSNVGSITANVLLRILIGDVILHSDNEHYLAHYGVLGMKWGVKRAARFENSIRKKNAKIDILNAKIQRSNNDKRNARRVKRINSLMATLRVHQGKKELYDYKLNKKKAKDFKKTEYKQEKGQDLHTPTKAFSDKLKSRKLSSLSDMEVAKLNSRLKQEASIRENMEKLGYNNTKKKRAAKVIKKYGKAAWDNLGLKTAAVDAAERFVDKYTAKAAATSAVKTIKSIASSVGT